MNEPSDHEAPSRRAARERLIVALDAPDWAAARPLADELAGEVGWLKVGLELFVREGARAVAEASRRADVFLDLKLHDIPATVEGAVAAAMTMGARLLTVHAASGGHALERAVRRSEGSGLTIVAVTVLTSLGDDDVRAQGIDGGASAQVERLASLAWSAGVRAFVASPHEVARIKTNHPGATVITPGIRPREAAGDDQQRVATAFDAIRGGSDRLVVGRPVRDATDRVAAARALVAEIEAGWKARE